MLDQTKTLMDQMDARLSDAEDEIGHFDLAVRCLRDSLAAGFAGVIYTAAIDVQDCLRAIDDEMSRLTESAAELCELESLGQESQLDRILTEAAHLLDSESMRELALRLDRAATLKTNNPKI